MFRSAPATQGVRLLFLVVVLADTVVAADDAEFAFNLLSDVAPVLALFGEQFAKQFMSESLTWFDHLVFAMVPLGILTAITGAIRVHGPRVARSFIGRARESRAVAEIEIMSSTSEEVCELFNGNSIVRAMGKPKITQLLVFPKRYFDLEEEYRKFDNSLRYTKLESTAEMPGDKSCGIHSLETAEEKTIMTRKSMSYLIICALSNLADDFNHVEYQSRSAAWVQEHLNKLLELFRWRRGSANTDVENTHKRAKSSRDEAETVLPGPPNLQLNLSSDFSDQGMLKKGHEIVLAAIAAVILQTGLIALAAVTAYRLSTGSSSLMESKPYGFPCYLAGSVLLSLGTGICSIIVEHSTIEHCWEVSQDDETEERRPRLIWLQQNQTVNDQAFDGFVILAGAKRRVITSRRRNPLDIPQSNHENKEHIPSSEGVNRITEKANKMFWQWLTVGAALSAGLGFTAQFMGLRGLGFPCSIAQIGAIFLMALVRAGVRRRLGRIPTHHSAFKGHELDLLATQIVFSSKLRQFSWLKRERHNSSEWQQLPSKFCCWEVITPKFAKTEPFVFHGYEKNDINPPLGTLSSQQLVRVRERLGDLCKWTSKSSEGSLLLAQSIELFLNTFFPPASHQEEGGEGEKQIDSLDWWIEASRPTLDGERDTKDVVHIPINREKDGSKWRVEIGKIDSLLSLWMATIVARRSDDTNSTNDLRAFPKHSNQAKADWRRIRAGHDLSYSFYRIIGNNLTNSILKRDISWWVDSRVAEQSDSKWKGHGLARNDDVDFVIGFNGISCNGTVIIAAVEVGSKPLIFIDTVGELAMISKATLPTILTQHLFTHFMWTISTRLPKNILNSHPGSDQDEVMIEGAQTFEPSNFAQSWPRIRLNHHRLTEVVALSSARLLPNEVILKLMPRVGPYQEWVKTAACYRELLGTIETDQVDEQDKISVAIVTHTMDFVSFAYEPYDKPASPTVELDEASFAPELDGQLRTIVKKLASPRFSAIMEKLAPVYERQDRLKMFESIFRRYDAWKAAANNLKESKNLDETFAENILGFSQQHCQAFSSTKSRLGLMITHEVMANESSTTVRDIFGRSPFNYLDSYNRIKILSIFGSELKENLGRFCKLVDNLGRNPLQIVAQGGAHVTFEVMFDILSNESKKSVIYASGMDDMTTLHLVSKSGNIDSFNLIAPWIKPLLSKTDLWGRQAIHVAAKYGHDDITAKLLDLGSRPDQVDETGKTPFDYFVETKKGSRTGNVTEQKTTGDSSSDDLSRKGVTLSEEDSALFLKFATKDRNCRYSHGKTLLHSAVEILSESIFKKMVDEMKFDMEAQDDDGQTPLHRAILASATGVAQALIEVYGVCKSTKDTRNNTPLMFAVRKNLRVVAEALLAGSDPCAIDETNVDGQSAIHWANTREMAEFLVEQQCSMLITDKRGRTALHTAIYERREDVALYLLELEPGPEPPSWINNESLLIKVCRHDFPTLIPKILERWPEIINEADKIYGQSPLSWACEENHDKVVEALLANPEIDVNKVASGWRNYTPLHLAVRSNSSKVLKLLLGHKSIRPDVKDASDRTPLRLAADSEHFDLAQQLLVHRGTSFEEIVRYYQEFISDLPSTHIFIPLNVLQRDENKSKVSEAMVQIFNDIMEPNTLEPVKVFTMALKGGAWKKFDFPYCVVAPLGVPELVETLKEQDADFKGLDEDNWSSADYVQRFDRTGELSTIVAHLQNLVRDKTSEAKVPMTLAWADYKEAIQVTPCDSHNDCSKVHGMVYSFTHRENWT
ncbi:unnamed protein product [Clonostachys rosea]|uniref:Uncharacterized protein n=1 Tax=Bionectria ochroleuca TaxID=29856 RepID=A0ABY6UYJ7_BIOOC|nr:unnamed protein product [Clonostachys rosea]